MTTPDITELRTLARMLALVGADTVRTMRGQLASSDSQTKSSITDLVTKADKEGERIIVDGIRVARPQDGVVGEEGASRPGTSGLRWHIDPIDGTTNYLYGFPAWCISVGVEDDAGMLAACVVDPVHGEVFTAGRGHGAELNGEAIKVRECNSLATALVGTGFSYQAETRVKQALVAAEIIGLVRDFRRAGAVALDICWVGCGRLDAFYERGPKSWDVAAASLIASEAGAKVQGYVEPGGLIWASTPSIAANFETLLTDAKA